MPRVEIKKNEYKAKDFSAWLIGKMWKEEIKQEDVAGWLGITQQGFSYKLRTSSFSLKDLIIIFSKIETEDGEIERLLR